MMMMMLMKRNYSEHQSKVNRNGLVLLSKTEEIDLIISFNS